MPQIKACDEITINTSIENVWNVLIDFPNYNKWWPKSVNLKVSNFNKEIVNTQFEARPLGGKSFSCRVVSVIPNNEIKLDYFEGIYRGDGVWSVQSEDSLVKVSYKVDLEIVDKSIAMLSRVISIPKLHSIIFTRILKGLAKQVISKFP